MCGLVCCCSWSNCLYASKSFLTSSQFGIVIIFVQVFREVMVSRKICSRALLGQLSVSHLCAVVKDWWLLIVVNSFEFATDLFRRRKGMTITALSLIWRGDVGCRDSVLTMKTSELIVLITSCIKIKAFKMYHFEEMCPPSFLKLNSASISGDQSPGEFSRLVDGTLCFLSNTHGFSQSQHIRIFNDTAHKDKRSAGESGKLLIHSHFSLFNLMGSILFLKLHTSPLVWENFNFYTNESVI